MPAVNNVKQTKTPCTIGSIKSGTLNFCQLEKFDVVQALLSFWL
jgi:hypothetical protein